MLRKRILLIFMLVLIVGCVGLKDKWNSLTPIEQSAIILDGLQNQVDIWHDAGIDFVKANPTYKAEWQAKVNPLFDLANQAIKDAIVYKKSPSLIFAEVAPTVVKATTALKAWGIFVDDTK